MRAQSALVPEFPVPTGDVLDGGFSIVANVESRVDMGVFTLACREGAVSVLPVRAGELFGVLNSDPRAVGTC